MLKYVIQPEMYMAELYKLYHFSGNIQHADGLAAMLAEENKRKSLILCAENYRNGVI